MVAEAKHHIILVIDDERGPRESMRMLLKNEYNVLCADSVDCGLDLLQQNEVDVVAMDIRMPNKNGIEGLRLIRENNPLLPVVLITGFGSLETAQEAIRLGANDYIRKPFDTVEMREVIQRNVKRSRLERCRRRAEKDIAQLNSKLVNELDQKDKLAALGQESMEFAHDIRNPLTAMLGYVDLLTKELKQVRERLGDHWPETSEYLNHIEKNVARCRDLSDLWMDRGKSGPKSASLVDIRELLEDVIRSGQHAAVAKRVVVELIPGEPSDPIMINRIQISRALTNILLNAIEAVAETSGYVRVWHHIENGLLEIGVEDNGCGMSPEQIQHVFEPFFTTKAGTGTGLGLAIVNEAIEAHKGTVQVKSKIGEGSKFIVRLPIETKTGVAAAIPVH